MRHIFFLTRLLFISWPSLIWTRFPFILRPVEWAKTLSNEVHFRFNFLYFPFRKIAKPNEIVKCSAWINFFRFGCSLLECMIYSVSRFNLSYYIYFLLLSDHKLRFFQYMLHNIKAKLFMHLTLHNRKQFPTSLSVNSHYKCTVKVLT